MPSRICISLLAPLVAPSTPSSAAVFDPSSSKRARLQPVQVHSNGGNAAFGAFYDSRLPFDYFLVDAARRVSSLRGNCVPLTAETGAALGITGDQRRALGAPHLDGALCEPRYLRLFTRRKESIVNGEDLVRTATSEVAEDRWTYLVPAHESFVWPAPYVGYSVVLRGFHRDPEKPVEMVTVSKYPRAFTIENFLTDAECADLIAAGRAAGLHGSRIVQSANNDEISDSRTSTNAWLDRTEVSSWSVRAANFTDTLPSQQESLQVLHYGVGEHYWSHCDFDSSEPCAWDGRGSMDQNTRLLTLFFYLNEGMEGGQTQFLRARDERVDPEEAVYARNNQDYVDCREGLKIEPRRGRALFWYNLMVEDYVYDPLPDPYSEHAACQVTEGEKWAANFWIHNRVYDTGEVAYVGGAVPDLPGVEKTGKVRWSKFSERTVEQSTAEGSDDSEDSEDENSEEDSEDNSEEGSEEAGGGDGAYHEEL